MPLRSPQGIPAAALGGLSPIDPAYKAEMYSAGRIPPREATVHWDHSIVKDPPRPPSPLQLPSPKQHQPSQQRYSPQRTSPYRHAFSTATHPSLITEEEREREADEDIDPLSPSTSTSSPPSLHLTSHAPNASSLSLVGMNLPPGPAIPHSPALREAQPGKITSRAPYNFSLYTPRAIDFADMLLDRGRHCIFRRGDCTDTVRARSVCWTCFERVTRLRRRREKWARWVGLLVWVGLQSAVVGIVVYLVMAEKHKRAMRQILEQIGAV
ncbi:hypothetical protein Slin15195_G020100 [Septoria linicola]|uniref:Uncharacterized protein n=1 Tax=Septoria linicola TaxID=215465 RepID=A0A9Q9EED9_9PEZI|nr:hypothetical protein Slin15195_G020100 [Septoria linicola]